MKRKIALKESKFEGENKSFYSIYFVTIYYIFLLFLETSRASIVCNLNC